MSLFDMVQGMGVVWIGVVLYTVGLMAASLAVRGFAQALRMEQADLQVRVACTKAEYAGLPSVFAREVPSYDEGEYAGLSRLSVQELKRKIIESRPPARVAAPRQEMPEWATKGTVRVRPVENAWMGAAMDRLRCEAERYGVEGKEENERIYQEVREEMAAVIAAERAISGDAGVWNKGAF